MLRQLVVIFSLFFSLLLSAASAHAGEAGRIVFVAGQAHIGAQAVALGDAVQEGAEIVTGADGYVYLKTIDDGFLILRPDSRARIVAYHVDTKNPNNTRVKLELLNGVARTISGKGVKQARQNFRFNTPVAAIGVRGTDFTVFTDQETSRVAVISGGVVVSGFSGACGPEGGGPCEGGASRELFANQVGQLLEVSKGQVAPQLMPSQGLSPDLNAPPRLDEPGEKDMGNGRAAGDINLDTQKSANLLLFNPPIVPPAVTAPPEQPQPQSQIIWGRWQAILGQSATIDLSKVSESGSKRVASNSYFAVLQSKGAEWQAPTQGSMGFALKQSEAIILDESSSKMTAARLEGGKLQVDFAKASFATSFTLVSPNNERIKFQALGDVGRDGRLYGANQFVNPTNMVVNGVVGPEGGGNAAYVFQGRIDPNRLASGVTYWDRN